MNPSTSIIGRRGWLGAVIRSAAAITLMSCSFVDPCAKHWDGIQIGDTRQSVIARLGSPNKQRGFSAPLVNGEEAVWEPLSGKRYTIYFAMDHVIGKALAAR